MNKAEELALKLYTTPSCGQFGTGDYEPPEVDGESMEAFIKGYQQAEKDCLLKINHLVNKVDIDNDAYEDLEDLYDSLCELIKHNRIGYIPEKDLELTWEDMMLIHRCIKDAMNYHLYKMMEGVEGQKIVYQEVLKRFKKGKRNDTTSK